jgi:hypothetical protein
MTELSTADSVIVRIYRIDTEDPCRGALHPPACAIGDLLRAHVGAPLRLMEALDGSGEWIPFTDVEELAVLLSQGTGKRDRRRKR